MSNPKVSKQHKKQSAERKGNPREWEKIGVGFNSAKGLTAIIYEEKPHSSSPGTWMTSFDNEPRLVQIFLPWRPSHGQQVHKKCSTSQTIRETQIETTMRYQLTSVRMAIIKKLKDKKCWQECRAMGALPHCCWKCKLVQLLGKTLQGLKHIPIDLPRDSRIPLSGMWNQSQRARCTPMPTADVVTMAKWWTGKMREIPTMEYLSLRERERETCHVLPYGWSLGPCDSQKLCDFILEVSKLTGAENSRMTKRGGNGEFLFSGFKI